MTWRALLLVLAFSFAVVAPWLPTQSAPRVKAGAHFPGWPSHFNGAPLIPMTPGPQDEYFTRDFPGRVARFTAGSRQVVVRWVNSPTRRLHPASHCFAGSGYDIHPEDMTADRDGALMGCFTAHKAGESLRVCEVLRGAAGESWPDVSSWYWHAVAAGSGGSWWSWVVVEHETPVKQL